MKAKINSSLIISILIPVAVGMLSALISGNMSVYSDMKKPPLAPPGFLFPVVWIILYILMGISSYLIMESKNSGKSTAPPQTTGHQSCCAAGNVTLAPFVKVLQTLTYYLRKLNALQVYALQLFFNFCWSIIFFRFKLYFLAFLWLAAMIALIVLMIQKFFRINPTAAYLQIPYLLWCLFAAYLNLMISILN